MKDDLTSTGGEPHHRRGWARPAIRALVALAALSAVALLLLVYASAPKDWRSRKGIEQAARLERQLVLYSVMHADPAMEDLLAGFRQHYPFIQVVNTDGDAAKTDRRFREEIAQGRPTADFIWSSAMDLQEKLINDGFSQPYTTPEMPFLPYWAHWQDLGYGVTLEPIAFVYNSRFVRPGEMARTHAGFRDLLRREPRLRDRIANYDPETSEVGMLLLSQDMRTTHDAWNLFDALGDARSTGYNTSRDMLLAILRGEKWVGYDVIASYAFEMQKAHPELVVVYPKDYVLVLSRVALITRQARHPNTARLFLDYLLSRDGQSRLKRHGMGSVRDDTGVPAPQAELDPMRIQAIRIGPGLLSGLDEVIRAQFLRRWRQARRNGSAD